MGDPEKVSRGQPWSKAPTLNADFINDLVDLAKWWRRNKAAIDTSGGGSSALESTSGLVKVKNLTGSNLLRGNYVQLGNYQLTDVEQHKQFYQGNLYDKANNGRIAILEKAVKTGDSAYVRARVLGKCTARINVTDTGHRFAKPDDGAYLLKSAATGDIEILSINKISGTGEQELAVVMGGGGGGTGTGKKTAIVKATGTVPAATDSGGARTPGASSAFDVKLGDDISGNQVENWSLTSISTGSYLAITEVIEAGESHYVIYNAFC